VILDQYRDLQLLHELTQNPDLTQRHLGKKTGLALGLINLRLHRLNAQGFIQIANDEKKRTRYLMTPQGTAERERLLAEYQDYSLQYYREVRKFLKSRLLELASEGVSKILLLGSGEMAEVAYLTLQEVGLTLVGVVDEPSERTTFLNLPIRPVSEISAIPFDRILVATPRDRKQVLEQLGRLEIPSDGIILWPEHPRSFQQPSIQKPEPLAPLWGGEERSHAFGRPGPSTMDVVILCGGKGTRLGSLTRQTPKPLLPVGGEPFLLRLLLRLKEEGFRRFTLAAHVLPEQFESFVDKNRGRFPGLRLVVEPKPLGTGGALRHAADHVKSSHFMVLNGDSCVRQPLEPVLNDHLRFAREFTVVAVKADRVEGDQSRKGVWTVGPAGEVLGFETQESVSKGWVNAGCYVLDRSMVISWPVGTYSLEANLLGLLKGRRAGIYCSDGELLDIGTPQTYGAAAEILQSLEGISCR